MALFNLQNNQEGAENIPTDQPMAPETNGMVDSNLAPAEGDSFGQPEGQGVKLTVESDTPSEAEMLPEGQAPITGEGLTPEEDPIEKYNKEQAEAAFEAVAPADPATEAAEAAITDSQGPEETTFPASETTEIEATPETEQAEVITEEPLQAVEEVGAPEGEAANQFETLTADMLKEVNDLVAERKAIEAEYDEDRRSLKEERDEKLAKVDERINAIKVDMHNALTNIHTAVEALPSTKKSHLKATQTPEKKAA